MLMSILSRADCEGSVTSSEDCPSVATIKTNGMEIDSFVLKLRDPKLTLKNCSEANVIARPVCVPPAAYPVLFILETNSE
jgi:hypothetical protein